MADDGERERKMKITVIGDTGAQCFSALGTGGNLAPRRARLKVVRKQNAALDALNAAFVTHPQRWARRVFCCGLRRETSTCRSYPPSGDPSTRARTRAMRIWPLSVAICSDQRSELAVAQGGLQAQEH